MGFEVLSWSVDANGPRRFQKLGLNGPGLETSSPTLPLRDLLFFLVTDNDDDSEERDKGERESSEWFAHESGGGVGGGRG